MNIIPAIDLKNSKCVRLLRGDFNQVTHYEDRPVDIALRYQQQGYNELHIVDLDAAKDQSLSQIHIIEEILKNTDLKVQVGGGIREKLQIKNLLEAGVNRVVLGSLAMKDVAKTKELLNYFGSAKIILALDIKYTNQQPICMSHGWLLNTNTILWDLLEQYPVGLIHHVLCTDIDCDGTLEGPNLNLYKDAIKKFPNIHWQASGGIHTKADVIRLEELGVTSVIIGKALLEGKMDL